MKSECGEFMNGTVRIYRPTNRKLVLSVRKLLSDLCDLCVNNFTGFAHFSIEVKHWLLKIAVYAKLFAYWGQIVLYVLDFFYAQKQWQDLIYVCKITVNNKLVFATSVQIFTKQQTKYFVPMHINRLDRKYHRRDGNIQHRRKFIKINFFGASLLFT